MKILMADDEPMALEELHHITLEVQPDAEIFCANEYHAVLQQLEKEQYDVAMLDIRMPGMSGLELAKKVKELQHEINIIFVTAYSEYALDAHELYASGYLMKPVNRQKVSEALQHLRYQETPSMRTAAEKGSTYGTLQIQCFGKFEVYAEGKPVVFQREKAKEIFAYLVDLKGSVANTGELCSVLWEDDASEKKKHYLRTLIRDIKTALKDCHAEEVLVSARNSFCINVKKVDCDYYHFLEQDMKAVNQYHGEYMKQYSWAEMTLGTLENL